MNGRAIQWDAMSSSTEHDRFYCNACVLFPTDHLKDSRNLNTLVNKLYKSGKMQRET